MEYVQTPNVLLEAMVILGAEANGFGQARLEERLRSKGVDDLTVFRQRYAPFAALREDILRQANIGSRERLEALFWDLPGFQYNTTGAFSPAFLLLFAPAFSYNGDLDAFLSAAMDRTPAQVARDILLALDMWEGEPDDDTESTFTGIVLSMTVPAESRLALLELHRSYREKIPEVGAMLRSVMAAIEGHRAEMDALAAAFGSDLERTGMENYLREITSLTQREGEDYRIYPMILGPDTNLFLDCPQADGSVVIYCGVLRQLLLRLVSETQGNVSQLCEAFHLLADRTRLEILLYLRDHPAYGQELADHFGLARNTIHHHMNKFYNAGLVTCTVEGARVYYALDKEHLRSLVEKQTMLFL